MEYLDQEEEAYYKAIRVAKASGFEDSEEESPSSDSEESGPEAGPSKPAPPTKVTPKLAKTKRKQTPKATGSTRKKRTNTKGEDDGFDLCEQTVKHIKGMATLMSEQLAMVKEGYEYLFDIFHLALQAAGGIKEDKFVAFIKQRAQSGNIQKLKHWIQFLEKELAVQQVTIQE